MAPRTERTIPPPPVFWKSRDNAHIHVNDERERSKRVKTRVRPNRMGDSDDGRCLIHGLKETDTRATPDAHPFCLRGHDKRLHEPILHGMTAPDFGLVSTGVKYVLFTKQPSNRTVLRHKKSP